MEKFTPADLVNFVKKYCPDVDQESCDAILNGKVTGRRALKYSTTEWTELGVPYGDAVDIIGAIFEFSQNSSHKTSPTEQSDKENNPFYSKNVSKFAFKMPNEPDKIPFSVPNSGSSSSSKSVHQTISVAPSGCLSMAGSSRSVEQAPSSPFNSKQSSASAANDHMQGPSSLVSTNSDEDDTCDIYDSLKPYFSAVRYSEMGTYEKDSFLNSKHIYEEATKAGHNLAAPEFMRQKPVVKSTPKKRRVATPAFLVPKRCTRSQSQVTLEEAPNTSVPSEATEESCNTSAPAHSSIETTNSNSDLSTTFPLNNALRETSNSSMCGDSEDFGSALSPNDSATGQDGSVSEPPSPSTPSTSATSSNDVLAAVKRRKRKKKATDLLSEDEFCNKLPKYDINEILLNGGDPLKDLRKTLANEAIVFSAQRKLMMRTLTKHLYYDEVGKVRIVTTDMKNGMAASIVTTYPLFKDETVPGKRSWWRIFDQSGPSGYIANCATSIFRKMKPAL